MRFVPLALAALILTACGGGDKPSTETPAAAATAGPATAPVSLTPCATCKVIIVTMTTDDKGNYFTPAKFDAHEGDIIRFTLTQGVHNANFLPDSNSARKGLPQASVLLQLPGQTTDVVLDFGTGNFYFQCDPHAALGMHGRVKVEKKG